MTCYYNPNRAYRYYLLVLLLAALGLAAAQQASAVGPPSADAERFAYARVFSAKVSNGLGRSLDELETIARQSGTEEIVTFPQAAGPEAQVNRWIVRPGSQEHAYPGVTVKARTHLHKHKQAGTLQVSKDGKRATAVLAAQNAHLKWLLPESARSPLSCDIYENNKLLAKNTIHERLSPSGSQRWPQVIRIDVPHRDLSMIQVFEYLDETPHELSSIRRQLPSARQRLPKAPPAGRTVANANESDLTGSDAVDAEEVVKSEAAWFSTSWGESYSWDSGWKPRSSPVQARFALSAGAELSSSVWGEFELSYTSGDDANLTLTDGTGRGNLEIDFGVEMSTRGRVGVDLGLKEVDFEFDIPYAPNFDLRCANSTSFDSYLLDSGVAHVDDAIDPQELFSTSVGGIPKFADVTVGLQADMSLWADMSADSISTYSLDEQSPNEVSTFFSEHDSCSVTLASGQTYHADVTYDEHLEMGVTVTFYPVICVNLDVWIYEWDYCVSTLSVPWDVVSGTIDEDELDFAFELHFEETYDLLMIAPAEGNTVPAPGIHTWNTDTDPCTVHVSASVIDPNYEFDYWILDRNDINTSKHWSVAFSEVNDVMLHTLNAVFFRAKATDPFAAHGADRTSDQIILSWTPGEHAADANGHDLYFGTDYDSVTDASTTETHGVYMGRTYWHNYDTYEYNANGLGQCETYYWRVDEVNDSYTGSSSSPWTGNIWRFTTLGCRASKPAPPNFYHDVPTRAVLSWTPGVCVQDVNGQEIYFGTDYNDVNDADTSDATGIYRGTLAGDVNSYHTNDYNANGLQIGTTYYWRVDQVNDAYPYVGPPNLPPARPPWKGPVWQFTVGHISIDDFEPYSDTNDLRATWKDRAGNNTGSWIELGIAPNDPVHGGRQSMIYDYNNTVSWGAGFYSEVRRSFDPPQDWTEQAVKALVMYFWGDYASEQMYVALQDSSLGFGVVECDNDANDPNEWNVDLRDPYLLAVDMNLIAGLYIGFGDRYDPQPGDSGTVYFDDIRLYQPRCRPEYAAGLGDISGRDCVVEHNDVEIMARDWLMTDNNVFAVLPPSDANLLVEYRFDPCGTYSGLDDSSGQARHGIDVNGVNLHDGILTLDGNDFVKIGGDFNQVNPFDGSTSFTIAMNIKTLDEGILISSARGTNPQKHSMAFFTPDWGAVHGNFGVGQALTKGNCLDDDWHHLAVTYDLETGLHLVYLDGVPGRAEQFDPNIPDADQDTILIGGSRNTKFPNAREAKNFIGDIDNVKIYDRALSPNDVCYLYWEHSGWCYHPLDSPANLIGKDNPADPNEPDVVDFKDYAVLAENWRRQILWP
jgi:hypothetical protein